MAKTTNCPSCKNGEMELFYEIKSVPTNSCILLSSREEAVQYPRGDIELMFCPECGFISNMAFDPKLTEYSGRYEETQGYSGTFNKFHKALAERLVDQYDLNDKDVLEIGCGKGEFITMLSELGNNRGVGFDPGYREERTTSETAKKNVTFITDFYSEKYAEYKADFVCCKMTLEHIHPTLDFITTVRNAIGDSPDTIVFFQIPEATRILEHCSFEDIYYEHCSYFSPGSLARLFRRCGFNVLNIETEYGDQYLTIEATPLTDGAEPSATLEQEDDMADLKASVATFPARIADMLSTWQSRIDDYARDGKKVVLWGSGSKGVSFLTTLKVNDTVQYVVDINPNRQGYFMSGTGQEIVSPSFLAEYKPDVVIVMNEVYVDEITADLNSMNLSPEVIAI